MIRYSSPPSLPPPFESPVIDDHHRDDLHPPPTIDVMINIMILIIGNGGREEALAGQIRRTSKASLLISPGNGGSSSRKEKLDLPLQPPYSELLATVKERGIDLVVVGPENHLSQGIGDVLTTAGVAVFGPGQAAAQLESSKGFAKQVMSAAGVPTADYREFDNHEVAESFLNQEFTGGKRWVLKADGLCAGKGVVVPETREQALEALRKYFLDKEFGAAGEKLIVEEFMTGEEASVLAFCDGKTVRCLPAAQDHKRIFDGDRGPNTGGMGVYTPVPIFRPGFQERVEKEILLPVLQEMERRGSPYKGILYAGLMIEGEKIRVVEFNVRFGDPECQCVLPLLDGDLVEVMRACIEGRLEEIDFRVKNLPAVCVVLASEGYPGKYPVGKEIQGLDDIPFTENLSGGRELGIEFRVFHAGTDYQDGKFFTAGGRVLSVCGYALTPEVTLEQVIASTYEQVKKIGFEGCYYRKDIGQKGLVGR